MQKFGCLIFLCYLRGVRKKKHHLKTKNFTIMEKEIIVRSKKYEDYKLILKVDIDNDDEDLLKKRFNLLALNRKLSDEQKKY